MKLHGCANILFSDLPLVPVSSLVSFHPSPVLAPLPPSLQSLRRGHTLLVHILPWSALSCFLGAASCPLAIFL